MPICLGLRAVLLFNFLIIFWGWHVNWLPDIIGIDYLPINDDSGLIDESFNLVLKLHIQINYFFFLLFKNCIIYCFTFLPVTWLGARSRICTSIINSNYFLEIKSNWFERYAIRRIWIQYIFDNLFQIEYIYFIILSEYCQGSCEIIFALYFFRCYISQKFEVHILMDIKALILIIDIMTIHIWLKLFQDQIYNQ